MAKGHVSGIRFDAMLAHENQQELAGRVRRQASGSQNCGPSTSLADCVFREETLMQRSTSKHLFGILVLGVLLVLGMSTDGMGQGRGRRASNSDRKCSKFVNCHDARDGRWDGRGPNRRDRFTDVFRRNRRDRDDRFERRRRNRDRDFSDDRWRWRRRR